MVLGISVGSDETLSYRCNSFKDAVLRDPTDDCVGLSWLGNKIMDSIEWGVTGLSFNTWLLMSYP